MYSIRLLSICWLLICVLSASGQESQNQLSPEERLHPYLEYLQTEGRKPVEFVLEKIKEHDLLIFDDAWHPAVEPFEFYQTLIRNRDFQEQVKFIFLEAVPVNKQIHLDNYFSAEDEDPRLLFPVFQDDFSGFGWKLKTYFDLLKCVYQVNQKLPLQERIKVFGCNNPSYWSEIFSVQDVELFRKSLIGNDYSMYKIILQEMGGFAENRKGIFLTNTRHAYKGIKNRDGQYFWNCGTFFHQWHPGKTFSIRFHHLMLHISGERSPDQQTARTTAGTERLIYRWARMENGLWDSAFAANSNQPVAVSLSRSPFGKAAYAGNHMHKAAPGQTMLDANDAIIFLKPLEDLQVSAEISDIYTTAFRIELERRYPLLLTPQQIADKLQEQQVNSLEELIAKTAVENPRRFVRDMVTLEAISAWQTKGQGHHKN